jgi:hypothetical protein
MHRVLEPRTNSSKPWTTISKAMMTRTPAEADEEAARRAAVEDQDEEEAHAAAERVVVGAVTAELDDCRTEHAK